MNKRNLAWIFVPALAFALAACEVEDKTPETGGPDMSIRSEERSALADSDAAGVNVQAQSESDTESVTAATADSGDDQPLQSQAQVGAETGSGTEDGPGTNLRG